MSRQAKTPELVSWHDNPLSGHAKGLITQHVKQPFYVDIDPRGAWVLHTLDKQDKPRFVDRGQAKTVTKAKADATAAALAKVPELKATLAVETVAPQARLEPQPISKRRAVLRWYGLVTTAILLVLLLVYHWFKHQPLAVTLGVLVLALGLYLTYHVTRFIDNEGAKLDRIAKRKQLSQAKAIANQHAPQTHIRQLPSQPTRRALP